MHAVIEQRYLFKVIAIFVKLAVNAQVTSLKIGMNSGRCSHELHSLALLYIFLGQFLMIDGPDSWGPPQYLINLRCISIADAMDVYGFLFLSWLRHGSDYTFRKCRPCAESVPIFYGFPTRHSYYIVGHCFFSFSLLSNMNWLNNQSLKNRVVLRIWTDKNPTRGKKSAGQLSLEKQMTVSFLVLPIEFSFFDTFFFCTHFKGDQAREVICFSFGKK